MKKLGPAHLAVSCFDGPHITWFSSLSFFSFHQLAYARANLIIYI